MPLRSRPAAYLIDRLAHHLSANVDPRRGRRPRQARPQCPAVESDDADRHVSELEPLFLVVSEAVEGPVDIRYDTLSGVRISPGPGDHPAQQRLRLGRSQAGMGSRAGL